MKMGLTTDHSQQNNGINCIKKKLGDYDSGPVFCLGF